MNSINTLYHLMYTHKGNITISELQDVMTMYENEMKDAYKHGRDDENCALSDGAMAPDYDNAEDWFKGEYGGDK